MMYVLFADLWSFSGKNGHNYIRMLVPTTSGGVQKNHGSQVKNKIYI